jgi:acyl carrier protein
MTRLEARQKILQALDSASYALHDPNFSRRLRDLNVDVQFEELELDSLAAIECCMALEESIGIEIDPAHLATYNSLDKLADYIAKEASA